MICPNCNTNTESVKSLISAGKVITGCQNCLSTLMQGSPMNAQHKREAMKREYAKDLVQPIDKDFARVYGAKRAKEIGWSDERIRRYT